jgi:hypothetical protein
MKPAEYLDATKARLSIESDYALAKALNVPSGNIAGIRHGARFIPLEMAFRIAITLELDPAQVIADLEEQHEKNAKRRGFWQSFLSRAASTVALLCCTLALLLSATCGSVQGGTGGAARRRLQCA